MQKIKKAALLFIFLIFIYALLRLIFYQSYFHKSNLSWSEIMIVVYWGFRIDFAAIFYSNIVFFLFYFLLSDFLSVRYRKLVTVLLLAVVNLPFLAINFIDLAYYKFNLRRSTGDIFHVIIDSLPATGSFLKTWWWLFILFFIVSAVFIAISKRIFNDSQSESKNYFKTNFFSAFFFLLVIGFIARGFSERPIIPSTPLLFLPANQLPLATNSTMTVLYSVLKRQTTLEEKKYFTQPQLDSLFSIRRQYSTDSSFKKLNVVFFILESFAKEYMDKADSLKASTPFLDSILKESIVCNNGYANGLESNKGIVALLASVPPFLDEPLYYSAYGNTNFRGIGNLLKVEGYNTSFFMGAGNDHFGFAKFAETVGIDKYYSMQDYGNKAHYDGNWGIYDHYFLPFVARKLDSVKQPFFASAFTISTHSPYKLPDTLKDKFTIKGQAIEQNSMSYLDYSLKLFFDEAKKQSWYNNTLFVFSADHNIFWHTNEKATAYKRFRIPIFFYLPGQQEHINIANPVQQLDIVPTILDMLHYKKPFMSFGTSIFDTLNHSMIVNKTDGIYQCIDSSYLLGYNDLLEKPVYLYNFKTDPSLSKNMVSDKPLNDLHALKMAEHIKAVLQRFNYSLLENKLEIK